MNDLSNLVRAELTRLGQPLTLVACLTPAAIIGALSVAVPPTPLVGAVTVFIGGHAAVTVAYLLATDFRLGVIATQLIVQRNRVQLMTGKLAVLASLATIIATIAFTSAVVASLLTGQPAVPAARLPALVVSTLGYAAVGLAAGALLRNPGGAVALAGIWTMSLDGLLNQLAQLHVQQIADWLPQRALTDLVALHHPARGFTVAATLLALSYATATHTFRRRDIS
jgi:ABC-2 type transport system permease protein